LNLPQNVVRCVCCGTGDPHTICWGNDGFQEKGKQVKLRARSEEAVKAVVIDGCLLSDKKQKCDGLFILTSNKRNNHEIYIVLVELKGTNIYTAFQQLESVKDRSEYKQIIEHFNSKYTVIEKFFIITNAAVSGPQRNNLKKSSGIKVGILTSAKTKAKALDLRKYL